MHRVLTIVTFLALLGAPAITAQEEPNLETQIAETIARYSEGDLHRVWKGCIALERFGEQAVPSVRRLLMSGSPRQKLMASKTLITLGETAKVGKTLRKLAEEVGLPDAERAAAIRLLVNFRDADTNKLLESLLEGEEAYNAELRIEAARTLFRTSRKSRTARKSLMPLLDVDDPAVQARAALALGEMGYVEGKCHRILQSLSLEPTPEGAQARLLIQSERLMRKLLEGGAAGNNDNTEQNRLIEKYEREIEKKDAEIADLKKNLSRGGKQRLITSLLDKVFDFYADPGRLDRNELLVEAAKGMISSLDPFSSFMDASDTSDFDEGISGSYAGIGAQVAKDREDRALVILRPIYKGPAYRLGLRSGDRITEVEGRSTRELELDDVIKFLKGAPGTSVNVLVHRRGWKEAREFAITRETIRLDSVHSAMLPGQLGYVHLSQFGDTAVEEFTNAVDALEAEGMKGLIFDLRNNPGGYLQAAVALVDEFVGQRDEPIVSQRGKSPAFEPSERFSTERQRDPYPVVVLVNRSSASASEIVSGALQDFERATIVGQRTFGKGSVQRLLPMPDGIDEMLGGKTTLRLTVQYYYLPSGRSIHAKRDSTGKVIEEGGVVPDVVVEPETVALWRLEAVGKLADENLFDEYLDAHYEGNREAFQKIAELGDGGQTTAYPDFESFFKERNKSNANLDDVRYELRRKIRRRVEDGRGAQYACDYPEDRQLQRAILTLLVKLQQKPSEVPEYEWFAGKSFDEPEKKDY